MTIFTETHPAPDATWTAFNAGRRLLAAWQRWRQARQTDVTLNALSDTQLHDIGLRRDQIDQAGIRTEHDAMRYSG